MHHSIGQKLFHAIICLHSALRDNKKLKTYTMLRHALHGLVDLWVDRWAPPLLL